MKVLNIKENKDGSVNLVVEYTTAEAQTILSHWTMNAIYAGLDREYGKQVDKEMGKITRAIEKHKFRCTV